MPDDLLPNLSYMHQEPSPTLAVLIKDIQEKQIQLAKSVEESGKSILNEIRSIMYEQRLEKKLKKIKNKINDGHYDQEKLMRKVKRVKTLVRESQSTDQIEKIGEQLEKIKDRLGQISQDASMAAQYADYRQTMEDARADFHLQQHA